MSTSKMQPLRRQIALTTFRPRPWRELSKRGLRTGSLPPRPNSSGLLRPAARRSAPLSSICPFCHRTRAYSTPALEDDSSSSTTTEARETKKSKPLRILFCGSDAFSCASLQALYDEHVRNPELVRSIDVVVRPGKPTGRGYKVIQHPPVRDLATNLGLPIHERDTFTGWNMPPYINLIIAVSFGLFVPPRLLRASLYGGLNVHPSLLPDLWGAAPLQHTLLAGRRSTGVSLQTLDERSFDGGLVLARTPEMPVPRGCDYAGLLELVKGPAAELLVDGLRRGVHVPPLEEGGDEDVAGLARVERARRKKGEGSGGGGGGGGGRRGSKADQQTPPPLIHAHKITKLDRQLRPDNLAHIWRRFRALGPLWFWARDRRGTRRRVIVEKVGGTDGRLKGVAALYIKAQAKAIIAGAATAADSSGGGTGSASTKTDSEAAGTDTATGTSTNARLSKKRRAKLFADGRRYAAATGIGVCEPLLVPLEVDEVDKAEVRSEVETEAKAGTKTEAKTDSEREHMVLWFPKENSDACYLGPAIIESVKVEGDKARPAARALKDFLVPVAGYTEESVKRKVKKGRRRGDVKTDATISKSPASAVDGS